MDEEHMKTARALAEAGWCSIDEAILAIAAALRAAAQRQAERDAEICDAMAAERQEQIDDPRNVRARTLAYFQDMQAAYRYAAAAIRAGVGNVVGSSNEE
jgi:hypothetical protein